jgi:hypothetical protein
MKNALYIIRCDNRLNHLPQTCCTYKSSESDCFDTEPNREYIACAFDMPAYSRHEKEKGIATKVIEFLLLRFLVTLNFILLHFLHRLENPHTDREKK